MSTIEEKLRERAVALLDAGEVASFIGWEATRFDERTAPCVIVDPGDANRLVYGDRCASMLAKHVLPLKKAGKTALCARGCETRAINRMIEDNQLKRDDVHIIGLPCSGVEDGATGELLPKCAACRHQAPVMFDEMIGEATPDVTPEGRFAAVEALEALPREERKARFDAIFTACIRCYACREACPCCTCRECFVDRRDVGWQGKRNDVAENRFYGLTRAFHVGDRCIECGECERVCPMGLPLMSINRKLIKDMNELFGEFESGMDAENPDVLRNFKLDDVEEFM